MNKVFDSAEAAIFDLKDGMTILVGGFGLCGNPENLLEAVLARKVRDLTVVSNNCGTDEHGLGRLLNARLIRKMMSSYVGENKEFERQFLKGELEVELIPQGTLAERVRAGGAGIAAFFTPTGYGTWVADGGLPMKYDAAGNVVKYSEPKETREIGGRNYVLEPAIRGDFAFVKAWKADRWGNLVFRGTARNFNPVMATAGKVTIAEVEEMVELGELDPDHVHTPGVYIHRIVVGRNYIKPIEQRTVRQRS
ncbi:MAG: CoA transferase subunit A [Myxococcales bacterium]|nr:CoA transferase subunit A [Myxococcales bacterium]